MDKEELIKLASKYQERADSAYQNYQETGMCRYSNAFLRNEELAAALRIAAEASDEHQTFISMKAQMSNFVWRAKMISNAVTEKERDELVAALVHDLVSYGRSVDLIS